MVAINKNNTVYSWNGVGVDVYEVLDVNMISSTLLLRHRSDECVTRSVDELGISLFTDLDDLNNAVWANIVSKSRNTGKEKRGIFLRYSDVVSVLEDEVPESKDKILSKLNSKGTFYDLVWDGNCSIFDKDRVFYLLQGEEVIKCEVSDVFMNITNPAMKEFDSGIMYESSMLSFTLKDCDGNSYHVNSISKLGEELFLTEEDAMKMINYRRVFCKE